MTRWLLLMATAGLLPFLLASPARAGEVPEKYRPTIKKALDYLASKQDPKGYWGAGPNDAYPVAITALTGLALFMDNGTVDRATYRKNLKLAIDWLIDRSQKGGQRDGLFGDPTQPTEAARYMYGHGYSL